MRMVKHIAAMLLVCLWAAGASWAQEGYGEGGGAEPQGGWAPRTKAEKSLAAALPTKPPEGWNLSEGPGIYDEEALYQHIDGAAVLFIDYGFRLVVTAQYTKQADSGLVMTVDVYDMGTPEMGFGIYSAHRPPDPQFVDVGKQGFVVPLGLFAYKGRYFVQVAVTRPGPETDKTMLEVGRQAAESLKGKAQEPKLLKYLPGEDLLSATIKITAKNVLGQSYLDNAVSALYKEGAGESRLLLIPEPSAPEAARNFAKYKAFVAQEGQVPEELKGIGQEAFKGEIPYNGLGIIFRQGRFLGGVMRIQDEERARLLLSRLLDKLGKG